MVQNRFNFSLLPLDLQKKLELLENQAQEEISKFTIALKDVLQHDTENSRRRIKSIRFDFSRKRAGKNAV